MASDPACTGDRVRGVGRIPRAYRSTEYKDLQSDWAGLPNELLECIIRKLTEPQSARAIPSYDTSDHSDLSPGQDGCVGLPQGTPVAMPPAVLAWPLRTAGTFKDDKVDCLLPGLIPGLLCFRLKYTPGLSCRM